MRTTLYLALLVAAIAGCGESPPRTALMLNPSEASPELRAACQLTEQKCTRCHPIGKLFAIDVHTREEWEPIVDRMRRISASSITMDDAQVVLRCLEARK